MATRALAPVLGLMALLGACAAPMKLPPDFLQLKQRSDFEAVTTDDARVRLRSFADPDCGALGFWVDAFRSTCTGTRGYTLVADGACTASGGEVGHWLEFHTVAGGEKVGYLVALFTRWVGLFHNAQEIVVVEFGAPETVFQARVDAVRQSLGTVRL